MTALAKNILKWLARGGAAALVLFVPGCHVLQNDWADLKEAGGGTTRLLNPNQGAVTSQGADIEQRLSRD